MVIKNACCVVDQFCDYPANLEAGEGTKPLRMKCFVCGQYVCFNCSSKRKYFRYGRVRICNNCQISELDNGSDTRVMARLRKLAGY